jgi:hypothetical protein
MWLLERAGLQGAMNIGACGVSPTERGTAIHFLTNQTPASKREPFLLKNPVTMLGGVFLYR